MRRYPATLLLTSGPINFNLTIEELVRMEKRCSSYLFSKTRTIADNHKLRGRNTAGWLTVGGRHIQFDIFSLVGTIYPDGFLPIKDNLGLAIDTEVIEERIQQRSAEHSKQG